MAFPVFPLPNSTILTDKVSELMQLSNPLRVEGQFFYQVPQGSQLQQFLNLNQKRSVVIVARVIQQTAVNTTLSMNITSANTETLEINQANLSSTLGSTFFIIDKA